MQSLRRVRYGPANHVRLSVPGRRFYSAYGSEHANSRDASGRRHRMAKDPEPTLPGDRGVETSPVEILYDRVFKLEQEVSALKRNLLIGSVDHE
jgi:hypothetical protein